MRDFFKNQKEDQENKKDKHNFQDANYIPVVGTFGENRLLPVNHICVQDDCVVFEDLVLPYGAQEIEEKTTFVIDEIIRELLILINSIENKEKRIIICGNKRAQRMLGRKLEDRIKREVFYE